MISQSITGKHRKKCFFEEFYSKSHVHVCLCAFLFTEHWTLFALLLHYWKCYLLAKQYMFGKEFGVGVRLLKVYFLPLLPIAADACCLSKKSDWKRQLLFSMSISNSLLLAVDCKIQQGHKVNILTHTSPQKISSWAQTRWGSALPQRPTGGCLGILHIPCLT